MSTENTDKIGDDHVEPPSGLVFSNLSHSVFVNSNQCGYEILEMPHAQDTYLKYQKKKNKRLRFKHQNVYDLYHDERRLRIMANSDYVDNIKQFLENCPHVDSIINSCDSKKRTALHFASARGSDEIVHLLLQHGANPNLKDFNGNSPLHLSACTHHIRVITLLLRYGADAKACDTFGKTPLHLALSRLRTLKHKDYESYNAMKMKAEVGEIVLMLEEYFDKSGQDNERKNLDRISVKLREVNTNDDMDEVGCLLADFTQMTIESNAKPKMSEE
ncbi:ankyrin repeat domain-containing protein 54 isoform X2 [Hydra vulgaris]|uniref:Ankyrin repeat domain-containing protein 54 isoform X2 n=1 Tax=Hydra vulgaris TaxID=6087 RepID=A0ABM4CVD2_HYDVU